VHRLSNHSVALSVISVLTLWLVPFKFSESKADEATGTALDIEYAEAARLSVKSLMLDITRLTDGSFVAVGERGHVIHSATGESWQQAGVVPTRSTLTTVASYEDRLWAAGHDSVILTSGDGGATWTRLYFDPDRQQPIMDLYFFDADNGIAIGAYGLALFTSDGGLNWEERIINEEEWHNNSILNINGSDLMVAGEAGFSYRSRDGGESWETLEMPYSGSMFGLVGGANDCLLVFGLRGHIQESCDFGDSWSELETNTESSISGAIEHDGKIIMVGNSGLVLIRDGNGSFSSVNHSSGVDFAAIVAISDGNFLLAGEDGIHVFPETGQTDQ
jgi:photosystem II stability/assembly factor-like uncharacterized protein